MQSNHDFFFNLAFWTVTLLLSAFIVYKSYKEAYVCTTCGSVISGAVMGGSSKKYGAGYRNQKKGSIFITLILIFMAIILSWLFIFPAIIYAIWRMTNREKVCAVCGKATLIPLKSPIGQKYLSDLKK
jgi:tellurite resistance protein TehA-like permease